MRVVVFGATGNVGTSVLRSLSAEAAIGSVLGVARRQPELSLPKVDWAQADIDVDDLLPIVRGADCVVHLAWRIQPSRNLNALWRTNVEGSQRIFRAVRAARVPSLVYASSVGVYSPGPKDRAVGEGWPRLGVPTSYYSLHKAEVERRLDRLEREEPELRVVRLRPGLVFKREAASGIRRLFAGPLLPSPLLRSGFVPFVPDVPGLVAQAVHGEDLADAYRRAVVGDAVGPFNVAADPPLRAEHLARVFEARLVRVPFGVLRAAASATWHLRLQPSGPGWVDLGRSVPIMDCTRARAELGWAPARSAVEALAELVAGLRESAGAPTPPLDPATGGPLRAREIATSIGSRESM